MFILNKKTGLIQECHNSDVIKICKKDSEGFAVAETKEELGAVSDASKEAEKKAQEAQKAKEAEEARIAEEAAKKAQEEADLKAQQANNGGEGDGTTSGEPDPATAGAPSTPETSTPAPATSAHTEEELGKMNQKQLREIAKELKIQGYSNMDNATLKAVIMAH